MAMIIRAPESIGPIAREPLLERRRAGVETPLRAAEVSARMTKK
jgi:hypothetical protein